MKFIVLFLFICNILVVAFAQDANNHSNIKLGFFTQMHYKIEESSAGNIDYGFKMRRLDAYAVGNIGKKVKWLFANYYQDFKFHFLELNVNYKATNYAQFQVGYFPPPGLRCGANIDSMYTSMNLVLIERPGTAGFWSNAAGLKNDRIFGLQIHGKPLNKLYYAAMLSNFSGNTQVDVLKNESNSNPSLKNYAMWGKFEYIMAPELRFGVHGHYAEGLQDSLYVRRNSCGAYILLRSKKVYFMAEFVGGTFPNQSQTNYSGYFVEAAYKLKRWEPSIRYNHSPVSPVVPENFGFVQNSDYTLGLNYYFSKNNKIQVNFMRNHRNIFENYIKSTFLVSLQVVLI